jgi:hypothetical protein
LPGDKFMQIENDYDKEVYNGDIGYIDDVDTDLGEFTASFAAHMKCSKPHLSKPSYGRGLLRPQSVLRLARPFQRRLF